jgi:hypothetical protein
MLPKSCLCLLLSDVCDQSNIVKPATDDCWLNRDGDRHVAGSAVNSEPSSTLGAASP